MCYPKQDRSFKIINNNNETLKQEELMGVYNNQKSTKY